MTPRLSATKTKLLYRYAVILVPLDLIDPKKMYVLSGALGKGSLKKKKKIREFSLRGGGALPILALFP